MECCCLAWEWVFVKELHTFAVEDNAVGNIEADGSGRSEVGCLSYLISKSALLLVCLQVHGVLRSGHSIFVCSVFLLVSRVVLAAASAAKHRFISRESQAIVSF